MLRRGQHDQSRGMAEPHFPIKVGQRVGTPRHTTFGARS